MTRHRTISHLSVIALLVMTSSLALGAPEETDATLSSNDIAQDADEALSQSSGAFFDDLATNKDALGSVGMLPQKRWSDSGDTRLWGKRDVTLEDKRAWNQDTSRLWGKRSSSDAMS